MSNNETQSTLRVFNPASLEKDGIRGVLFSGTYQGFEETTRARKSDGEEFLSQSHKFIDEEGNTVIVNATGQLNYLIRSKSVSKGDHVTLSYRGKEEAKIKGVKRKVHTFDIEIE